MILNSIGLGLDPLSAVLAPRVHTQLLPDSVDVEDQPLPLLGISPAYSIAAAPEVYSALTSRGHHNVSQCTGSMGVSQLIYVDRDTGNIYAVSDARKDGKPAGWGNI